MKCVILHESKKTIRVRVPQTRLSLREADILEYYIRDLSFVQNVKVNDRSKDMTIFFTGNASEYKDAFAEAMSAFSYRDEKILALVPEDTGREMNRQFEEQLVTKVAVRILTKYFLPPVVREVVCIAKSVPYIIRGIKSLMNGKIEVELLDATAIAASMLRGDYDTASSIMFLLDVGGDLEDWTRKKSIGDLARSMCLSVDRVWLKTDEGEVQVSINQVHAGDRIILRNSDLIPLDGRVVSGEMTVNQSTMTGESEPVIKSEGGFVYAGTVVEEGECIVEITKESGSGKYDQIVHMIEESEKLKSGTEAKAYQLADRLVPYSFVGAITTYLLTRNVNKALSFLMVDYSCAMKLSMPLAVLSAIREAREHGISIKGGKFMEAVAEADTIVFDKTGTLTHAEPKLVNVVTLEGRDPDEMLRIAACLEEHYPHSVANAIVQGAAAKGLSHEELHSKVQYIVAHGVSSALDEKKIVIGSRHFVLEDEACMIPEGDEETVEQIPGEYTQIYMGIDGRLAAVLCISDPVREDAAKVVDELHRLGINHICMMTGDNKKTAASVAQRLNLDDYCAEVLPEDKAAYIRREHEAGRKVIMVGDGVNDTPALAEADVGIAISDGAAIAREIADITIASDDLKELITLRRLSTELMKRIRGNYNFILSFNSTLIALGVLGIMTPSSSALLHNGSTILSGIKSMTPLESESKVKKIR